MPTLAEALTVLVVLVGGAILLIWWLPLLGHEVGQFLGASIVGARYDYIPLGPLVVSRGPDGRALRLHLRRFPCDSVLPGPRGSARAQLMTATLAGPLVLLLFGSVGLAIVATGRGMPGGFWSPLVVFLLALFTTITGVALLLPWRPYGVPSDGLRLISILRNTASGDRWIALRRIARQSDDGVRPRDWEGANVAAIGEAGDGSIDDVSGTLTLYWHHLDAGRDDEARVQLERARLAASVRYLPGVIAKLVALEVAYQLARTETDPPLALADLLGSAAVGRASLQRALSAILLLYADFAAAEKAAEEGLGYLNALRPGFAQMERDLLLALREEARQRRS